MRMRVVLILWCAALLAAGCGSNSSGNVSTPTTPTANNQQLNACRVIAYSASYTLTGDIGPSGPPGSVCLTIAGANVKIDCAHHTINGYVDIDAGDALVSISNCTVGGFDTLQSVSNVTISNSVISDTVTIASSHNVVIDHDQITPSTATASPAAAVYLFDGGSNQVTESTLDGGYHGDDLTGHGTDAPGADDGVVLMSETGDLVQSNTIQNVYDAGVEGVDTVSGTTISNNTISHAIAAGIASYWCTHWETNTVSGNAVTDSLSAVWIIPLTGSACGTGPTPAPQFTNNTIAGNTLRGALGAVQIGMTIGMTGPVSSNVVSGNDIGTTKINLSPASGFSDGGGNICGVGGTFKC